jgi:hypothetical protein
MRVIKNGFLDYDSWITNIKLRAKQGWISACVGEAIQPKEGSFVERYSDIFLGYNVTPMGVVSCRADLLLAGVLAKTPADVKQCNDVE